MLSANLLFLKSVAVFCVDTLIYFDISYNIIIHQQYERECQNLALFTNWRAKKNKFVKLIFIPVFHEIFVKYRNKSISRKKNLSPICETKTTSTIWSTVFRCTKPYHKNDFDWFILLYYVFFYLYVECDRANTYLVLSLLLRAQLFISLKVDLH